MISFGTLSQESKPHYIKFSKLLLISLLSYLMINIKVLSMQIVFFAHCNPLMALQVVCPTHKYSMSSSSVLWLDIDYLGVIIKVK